jgi:hypothetical protein
VTGRRVAGLLFGLVVLSACGSPVGSSSSIDFGNTNNTRYLKAGRYAVAVATDCGVPLATVAGQIDGKGWSNALLNGTPLTIPTSGDYTVVNPIGSDLMGDPSPCSLALTVALTPMSH